MHLAQGGSTLQRPRYAQSSFCWCFLESERRFLFAAVCLFLVLWFGFLVVVVVVVVLVLVFILLGFGEFLGLFLQFSGFSPCQEVQPHSVEDVHQLPQHSLEVLSLVTLLQSRPWCCPGHHLAACRA